MNQATIAADPLIQTAVAHAQAALPSLAAQGVIVIGQPLLCAVAWPKAHKGEPFLFLALAPDQAAIGVLPLTPAAEKRLTEAGGVGDTFKRWLSLQTLHEHVAFRARTEIIVLRSQHPSGLALPQ